MSFFIHFVLYQYLKPIHPFDFFNNTSGRTQYPQPRRLNHEEQEIKTTEGGSL